MRYSPSNVHTHMKIASLGECSRAAFWTSPGFRRQPGEKGRTGVQECREDTQTHSLQRSDYQRHLQQLLMLAVTFLPTFQTVILVAAPAPSILTCLATLLAEGNAESPIISAILNETIHGAFHSLAHAIASSTHRSTSCSSNRSCNTSTDCCSCTHRPSKFSSLRCIMLHSTTPACSFGNTATSIIACKTSSHRRNTNASGCFSSHRTNSRTLR